MAGVTKILVADDEAQNRTLLRTMLEGARYIVVDAADGPSALVQAARHQPDLVLLDVRMPGLDGFEVTRRLRSQPATALLPVILVTGLTELHDKVRGLDAGATDFVTKPFQQAELLARVRANLRTQAALQRLESAQDVLVSLANAVEAKDPSTEHHCGRLAQTAMATARAISLPDEEAEAISYGAALHDVGKIGIAEHILRKPGPLSEIEWQEMRRHPAIGAAIVEPLHLGRLVTPIIRHHHEHWDGSGYPDGLRGLAIPIGARIVSVVDAFDAMTHDRPYRPTMSSEQAVAELAAQAGRQFDGDLVTAFVEKVLTMPLSPPADALAAYTQGLYQSASAGVAMHRRLDLPDRDHLCRCTPAEDRGLQ